MPKKAGWIPSGDEVTLYVDLSPVIQFLAAGDAMTRALENPRYADGLFESAFAEADEVFNTQAAAYAAATGNISHMYEWGTTGINRGRSNMRPNPMSPTARLWKTVAVGKGFDKTITYNFLPSKAIVPKPTGFPNIDFRDHVFVWKAEVMEWGRQVTIYPKEAKFLFIPVTPENEQFVRPHDRKRGYTLSKGPISFNAGGRRYANNFTNFFTNYWYDQGDGIIQASIQRQALADFEPELRKTVSKTPTKPKPNVTGKVRTESKKIEGKAVRKANTRAANKKTL